MMMMMIIIIIIITITTIIIKMGKGYDKQGLQPTTGSWTLPPSLVWGNTFSKC